MAAERTYNQTRKVQGGRMNGSIDRRFVLGGGAALAASSILGPLAMAQSAKKGGTFRLGVLQGDSAETLDPARTAGAQGLVVQMMTRNGLAEILPDGKLGPELAESWEADAKLTRWVFRLRKGVEFHSGRPFTSADVLFSINHHLGESSKSAMKGVLSAIAEMRADGPSAVVIDLNGPNADFPYVFADYAMRIFQDGTTNLVDGNGTGPYRLTSFEPGVRAGGKRNPNYFKSDRAHFDAIELVVIPDESARISALRTGEIDAIDRLGFKTVQLVARVPGLKVLNVAGRQHFSLPMLTDTPPFDNNDVRLALKYAIDREAIVKLVLNDLGSVGNDQPIARENRFFAADLPQRVYDPEKARFHLKKADAEGQSFQLHVSDAAFAGAVDLGTLYKEQAAKAGVTIDLVREPNDGYWSKVWRKVPWCAAYWSGRPTEDWMLTSAYAADAAWNDSNWKNLEFNKLLVAARGESDEEKRRSMYAEMQRLIRDEGGVVIPVFANYVSLTTDKVGYGQVSSMWVLDGYKATERWWFV
jgi:peptide/nickel transport system substrate-binding protein